MTSRNETFRSKNPDIVSAWTERLPPAGKLVTIPRVYLFSINGPDYSKQKRALLKEMLKKFESPQALLKKYPIQVIHVPVAVFQNNPSKEPVENSIFVIVDGYHRARFITDNKLTCNVLTLEEGYKHFGFSLVDKQVVAMDLAGFAEYLHNTALTKQAQHSAKYIQRLQAYQHPNFRHRQEPKHFIEAAHIPYPGLEEIKCNAGTLDIEFHE